MNGPETDKAERMWPSLDSVFLITGGAGFIGSNIASFLARRGYNVRIFDDFSSGREKNLSALCGRVEVIRGDVRDRAALRMAMRGCRFVLHLAARPSVVESVTRPLETHDVNLTGTLNVLAAARESGVHRMVFSSSCAVYGDSPQLPKHEGLSPRPLSPYAAQKLAGEYYAAVFHALHGLGTVSLRYFNVYGPAQNPASDYAAAIPRFLMLARRGEAATIYGDGLQTRDFVFVEDVALANVRACTAPHEACGQVFNIGSGKARSILETAQDIRRLFPGAPAPRHAPPRPGDIRDSVADICRAREALGWEPQTDWTEGLRRTAEYLTHDGTQTTG